MGRTFATSDFHGNWTATEKLLNFLKSDDKLYFLGDVADRDKYGIRILQKIMKNPNIFMLMGNHDKWILDGIASIEWRNENSFNYYNPNDIDMDIMLWTGINGGEPTFNALCELTSEERMDIYHYIKNLPTNIVYYNKKGDIIYLEHAGFTPNINPGHCQHRHKHDPLWDRGHFEDDWYAENNVYVVHGHTPVPYLRFEYPYKGKSSLTKEEIVYKKEFLHGLPTKYKPTILHYCGGHKINIDMCTIVSNRVALLDLDTFDEYYFDGKDD